VLCDEEASRLSSAAWHRRFYAGQIIHAEGEKPASFCAVMTGVVKLMKSLPNGNQQIVGLLLPGDFLGRPFGQDSRSSAVAATHVKLCWFPRAVVEGLASESRALERWLFDRVSDELEKAQDWIVLLGRMTAEQRIATFILSVVRSTRFRDTEAPESSGAIRIELPLSRTEIADYLGLTIETVSRQIARLRERGVITVGGASRAMMIRQPEVLEATLEAGLPGERSKEHSPNLTYPTAACERQANVFTLPRRPAK
jgi:CRP/FNR family transcriptional regulator